ncbi:MAG: amino acid decarboxylase, partial [Oscillospiraceae bacterium]
METPIADFVNAYLQSGVSRLHMPGHKGCGPLGCERLDITEIAGADELYQAEGIIARSEHNAATLFGTAATFYSTEGSSQCIRAMLYLALLHAPSGGERPVIVAARNAHQSFVLAAALLDLEIVWLWAEELDVSLCRCNVSPEQLERALKRLPRPPVAVYITAPDYLGSTPDIAALAETAHRFGTPLLVDNAHGAYLKFLPHSTHPMDLGADLCCDSAHKTLPVLTGGAYLHVSHRAPADFIENGKRALALFGSTSPSYLILQSLDLVNRRLAEDYPNCLADC